MMSFKMSGFLLMLVAIILMIAPSTMACIANGRNCQPDGSLGNCCTGNCYKQQGWAMGDCR
ncbi:antimicrobial peptide Alo-2-like [Leptopilina boulardi]|uniref:antimicrobial peptide Alo-2-like n=1 Tax=Leptopilina boulardi TaxID=63433 RepID=UPI0021F64EE0|nr:antimicrobial peptide Alo-2-like [Leptopilina boulardi]